MSVARWGERGTTTPLHSGQWRPHPAPDPVARTYAPHTTTPTSYTSNDQANQANPLNVAVVAARPDVAGVAVATGVAGLAELGGGSFGTGYWGWEVRI
jgi:hypothetical protein